MTLGVTTSRNIEKIVETDRRVCVQNCEKGLHLFETFLFPHK